MFAACSGEQLRAARIRLLRTLRINFAAVDIGPGGAINHDFGTLALESVVYLELIGDVQRLVIKPYDIIPGRAVCPDCMTDQSCCSGNQDSQRAPTSIPYCRA